jgi:hypothetical protein
MKATYGNNASVGVALPPSLSYANGDKITVSLVHLFIVIVFFYRVLT